MSKRILQKETPPTPTPKPIIPPLPSVRIRPPMVTAKSIVMALIFVGGGVGALGYAYIKLFGERDKERLSKTASQIGRNALSDEELIKQANLITHNIVSGILNDPHINQEVTRLLSNVVVSPQVQQSASTLVHNLVSSE